MLIEAENNGKISISSFYIRRIYRIAPLYLLAFFITAAASAVIDLLGDHSKLHELQATWPWALSFNRELCPVAICGDTFFGHAWTIGIEEKYYILWPMIFAASAPYARLTLFIVMALAALLTVYAMPPELVRGYLGIIFGCYGAFFYAYRKRQLGNISLWVGTILLGYILSTFYRIQYGNILISFSASWIVVYMTSRPSSVISRVLSIRPLAWLGRLTYGIYLFHLLAINLVVVILDRFKYQGQQRWMVVAILGYLLSVATAYFFHKTVEQPMILLGRKIVASRKNKFLVGAS